MPITTVTAVGASQRVLIGGATLDLFQRYGGYLSFRGAKVEQTIGLDETLDRAALAHIDVAVVDRDLFAVGAAALDRLARKGMGVILIASSRNEEELIHALENRADDYLTLSCSPHELLARIKAISRGRIALQAPDRPIFYRDHVLDRRRCELRGPGNLVMRLTEREVLLMGAFLHTPGAVLDRDRLLDLSYAAMGVYDRSIDQQVSRLRRKLMTYGFSITISTIYGAGYVLVAVSDVADLAH